MPRTETPPKILIPRGRGAAAEAQRDADVLRFVGRFRFVTDELLAKRFGVSRQQMNLRLRRLTAAGLLQRSDARTQPRVTMLTRKGARAVDLPRRRTPRTDAQREHELSLVWLVIELERVGDVPVRTERECRALHGAERRYCVDVRRPGRDPERRWPDLVLDGTARRSAIELELTAKGAPRLQSIVEAYAVSSAFDEVLFLAGDVLIARRISRALLTVPTRPPRAPGSDSVLLRVAPTPTLDAAAQRSIVAATNECLGPAD